MLPLEQGYQGDLMIVVVDDDSEDGTANVAHGLGAAAARGDLLTVVAGRPLPPNWGGKLWTLQTALEAAGHSACEFVLLTDADIAHPPDSVGGLVNRAISTGLPVMLPFSRLELSDNPLFQPDRRPLRPRQSRFPTDR